jgi:hypothetical protein
MDLIWIALRIGSQNRLAFGGLTIPMGDDSLAAPESSKVSVLVNRAPSD